MLKALQTQRALGRCKGRAVPLLSQLSLSPREVAAGAHHLPYGDSHLRKTVTSGRWRGQVEDEEERTGFGALLIHHS